MILSFSLESNLSHTSIVYCGRPWSQILNGILFVVATGNTAVIKIVVFIVK